MENTIYFNTSDKKYQKWQLKSKPKTWFFSAILVSKSENNSYKATTSHIREG